MVPGVQEVVAKDTNRKTILVRQLTQGDHHSVEFSVPQLDGAGCEGTKHEDNKDESAYSFISNYWEHDILFTLKEVFKEMDVTTKLVSRLLQDVRSANQLCSVVVNRSAVWNFSWAEMKPPDAVVKTELKKINIK